MKAKWFETAKRGFKAMVNGARRVAEFAVEKGAEVVTTVAGGLGLNAALHQGTALAQDTAPDASTIVTTASTTFSTVGALVASAVGFFIIVKIVKWIRK